MQSDVTMKVYEEFPDVHVVELNVRDCPFVYLGILFQYRLELPTTETKYTVTYGKRPWFICCTANRSIIEHGRDIINPTEPNIEDEFISSGCSKEEEAWEREEGLNT